ncbi:MAG: 6-phosphogluconate dehydrogenase [Burkholderiales bacterium]|nr:MAG: 6-phosphogluconate dehydrogenase [Burkholderiales bacterium]
MNIPSSTSPFTPPRNITIAGFGDVGQVYAQALLEQGVQLRLYHPAPGTRTLQAAARFGLRLHTEPAEAFADCDLVLNLAPGPQALPVASAAAPHLKTPGALFADLSSAAPDDMRTAAGLFEGSGYVDAAIMGAVSIHGHRTPLLASGAGAASLAERLSPLGFVVDVLPESRPGDATALKLVRSVLTKGMDGVITECLLVAEALGLRQTLLANIGDLDRSTLTELMAMFIRTHAPHAQRRLHEMETVEATLKDLGVPLIVTSAVRQRFARTVALHGANPQLPEGTPAQGAGLYDRVLPWMLQAERAASTAETPNHLFKETP